MRGNVWLLDNGNVTITAKLFVLKYAKQAALHIQRYIYR